MSMYRWLALATALMAPVAYAQDEVADEGAEKPWSVTLGFLSDYKFRGISQTNEDPAVQVTFNYGFDNGVYVGAFASNVDFVEGDGANQELDLFLGYAWDINDSVAADVSWVQYLYPFDNADYNYGELIGKLTFWEHLSASVGYSNNVFATDETGIYYGLSGNTALSDYTFSASVGYYDLDDALDDSIVDYSVAVSRDWGPITVSVGYYDTNGKLDSVYGQNNDGQAIISFSTTF